MINTSESRIIFNGNGTATEFPYSFAVINDTDVKVMTVDPDGVETVLDSDYYVDVTANKVIYPGYPPGEEPAESERPPVLPTGWQLVVYRDIPVTQEANLGNVWPFNVIEDALDKITMILQTSRDTSNRSLKVSESTPSDVDVVVPVAPNMTLKWDAQGKKIVLTADPAEVLLQAQNLLQQTTEQAKIATTQADIATSKANAAAESAVSAATSESNVGAHVDKAKAWAESETSPDGEPDSKSAKTWASESLDSAELAQKWAESDESPDGEPDSKSAKTWAEKAIIGAAAAAESESNAAASATAAAGSASAATTQADIATSKANAAAESAVSAATSESNAAASATAAAGSASAATTQAGIATTKAAEAASSATSALDSENAASTSAGNAATSEKNAGIVLLAASKSATAAAASAQEAADIAHGIGNPVSDVTENNGTVTVVKSDGTSSSFDISHPAIATQEEAEAGTDNTKFMTPLRTKEAIAVQVQGIPIGDVVYRPFLMAGYVKANGATVNRSDYRSLATFATNNNLWTFNPTKEPWMYGWGDGSTTMVLPDFRNRFIEGSDNADIISAGLPNINGTFQARAYQPTPSTSGAFTVSRDSSDANQDSGNASTNTYTFNASRSNAIYGGAKTVQPASICLIPQIKF